MKACARHTLSFLMLAACIFFVAPAFADDANCPKTGDYDDLFAVGAVTTGSFGTAVDYSGTTQRSPGSVAGVFASVLTYFRSTVGQLMSAMYFAMQCQIKGPLATVLTLFVVVFGIAIITGLSRFTYKEAAVVLFKIGLIYGFVTNAEWGIGFAYKFFMAVAEEGSNIVLSAICGGGNGGNVPMLDQPDTIFTSVFNLVSGNTVTDVAPPTSCLRLTGGAPTASLSKIPAACTSMMMMVFGLMLFLSPAITSFAAIMVVQFVALYARALLGYLTSIVLISFLFVLSPLFISFALFKVTEPLFKKWLSYLTTFSVQMIIIFGFLALLALVAGQLSNSLFTLANLLKEYDVTVSTGILAQPMRMCSICAYTITQSSGGLPTAQCGGSSSTGGTVTGVQGDQVIPIFNLFEHQDFIVYVLSQTLAWWLIAYVLQEFLKKAPELARAIGGASYAPSLGGEGGAFDVPGIKYPGLGAAGAVGQGVQKWWSGATATRGAIGGALGLGGAYTLLSGRNPLTGAMSRPEITGLKTSPAGFLGGDMPSPGAGALTGVARSGAAAGSSAAVAGGTRAPGGAGMQSRLGPGAGSLGGRDSDSLPTEDMLRAGIEEAHTPAEAVSYVNSVLQHCDKVLTSMQGLSDESRGQMKNTIDGLMNQVRIVPSRTTLNKIFSALANLLQSLKQLA